MAERDLLLREGGELLLLYRSPVAAKQLSFSAAEALFFACISTRI